MCNVNEFGINKANFMSSMRTELKILAISQNQFDPVKSLMGPEWNDQHLHKHILQRKLPNQETNNEALLLNIKPFSAETGIFRVN